VKKKTVNILKQAKIIFIVLFLFCNSNLSAQDDILKKPITAEFNNIRLNDAFRQIEKQLSIYFTFDGSLINTNKKINHSFKSKPLSTCLDLMLEDSSLFYKVIENHIVIRCCKHFESIKTDSVEKPKFLTIKGKVLDKASKEPLAFASISIKGQSIGGVSNQDGEFILKIPEAMRNSEFCVTCLGFTNLCFPVSELVDISKVFLLERNYISLQEVIIRKTDARNLILEAFKNAEKNYSKRPVYLTGFYRESVNKGNKYMFYSEAVTQIYKGSNLSKYDVDLLKILKSRKMQDISMEDTIVVKLKSGLQAMLDLDIVKNPGEFLDEKNFNQYKYIMSDIVSIDNRTAYQIEFSPLQSEENAIYEGKLYIDIKDLAIVACEFRINKNKIGNNQGLFVAKKKKGLRLKMSNVSYSVSYRKINEKYYLNYVSGNIDMRIRKKSKLFFSDFDIAFEMAINELETNNVERFKTKDAAKLETIFFDEIYSYDEAFWEHYNFIMPDKPLEKALKKDKTK
jgi:hypothetical protein